MPAKPPHHVSSQEFQNPHPPRSVEAYSTKRTLNKTHATGVPPLYLTPVFQPGSSHTPITQNEPNLSCWRAQLCETNPICPYPSLAHDPNMRNEPNSSCGGPVADQKMRNEPNFHKFRITPRPDYAKRTQSRQPENAKRTQFSPQPPGPRPKCAKRTQFSHTKCCAPHQKCKTNPIYRRNPPSPLYFRLSPLSRATARAAQLPVPLPRNQTPSIVFRRAFRAPRVH